MIKETFDLRISVRGGGGGGHNGCWTSCLIDYVLFVIKTILVINFIIYLYVPISLIFAKSY